MKINSKLFIYLVLISLLASATAAAGDASAGPVRASHALVVSIHELASQAGVDVLKAGGNAVDAAVATGFALAVVHPQAGNLGGGGFMLLRLADGTSHFLDYREKAPAAARKRMYLDSKGNVIENASLIGYKAAAVPGSVAGLAYAQKKWGKLPLARVMAPAIHWAKQGFALTQKECDDLRDGGLAKFPASRRIFQREGKYYQAGEIFRQPELARTLERIAANPDDFYHGSLARELAAAIQKGGGLVTARDLAQYDVKEREPLTGRYRQYEVLTAPPPSSGGIVLLEALNILEGYPVAGMGSRSPQFIHLASEAFRRAFYDRAEFLGDPDFTKIPTADLVSRVYAARWREFSMNAEHASPSASLKRPGKFGQVTPERPTEMMPPESMDTTHYSVVDEAGNAIAVSTTLNDLLGSRVTVEGLGFLLNDEMDDFSSKSGSPNVYGLLQGSANAIAPGKRPLSSMTPTILLKDGKPYLVLGSPGGPRIITTVANIIMGVVDFRMSIQQAVNAPRFHHQWMPDKITVEKGFPPETFSALKKRGHAVEEDGLWSDGECIEIDPGTGDRLGASDFRNHGKAVGF
jgi:gamma-glutamyltranspeptidase/glutathione hydrolase